jgi:photosystem II stability/assembly factor-like uncharacterized protein
MKTLSAILQISRPRTFLVGLLGIVLTVSSLRAQEERKEDPERITHFWRTALSPDDYMRALQTTGQIHALQKFGALGDTSWTPIGPTGNFNATDQNDNGRIRSIHIQTITGDYYVYVGGSSGGLWRARGSTGPVWTSLGDNLPNPSVGDFAVNPSNTNDILVGTGDYNRYGGAGMFRTTNAGQTWAPISLPISPEAFFRINYLPGNSNVVLAASNRGLLRSTSGPNGPWTVVLSGFVADLAIHPTTPSTQFCCRASATGISGGIYKSTDSGQTWNFVSTGAPTNAFGIGQIAICRNTPSTLAFVYEWGNVIAGIRKSTNSGTTWTDISGSLLNTNGQAFHALTIGIRPNNANEIYVGSVELYRSTDGGVTWPATDHNNVHRHDDHTQVYFSPATGDNIVWFCNDGGVYRWTIGASTSDSWNGNQSTGLRVSQVYQMDAQRDLRLAAMQDVGIVGSANTGTNWSPFECCDGDEVEIIDDIGSIFWYISGSFSPNPPWRAFRQTFSGAKQTVSDPFADSYRRLFFDRYRNRIYSVNADGTPFRLVSSPTTGALAWQQEIALNSRATHLSGNYFIGDAIYAHNYWGTDTLIVLEKTSAGWSPFYAVLGSGRNIATVFVSTERLAESWVGLGGGIGSPKILHTTDYWRHWTDLTGSLTNVGAVRALVVAPFNSQEIYAATDIGMFRTLNGGETWEPFQSGLPLVICTDLRYIVDRTRGGNDKLVVSTFGRGLYECTLKRQPLVYVDLWNPGFEDGTFTHPYNTFDEGFNATPNRGMLALRGMPFPNGMIYTVPATITKPLTINAYDLPVLLQR